MGLTTHTLPIRTVLVYTIMRHIVIPVGATGWSPEYSTGVIMPITLKND